MTPVYYGPEPDQVIAYSDQTADAVVPSWIVQENAKDLETQLAAKDAEIAKLKEMSSPRATSAFLDVRLWDQKHADEKEIARLTQDLAQTALTVTRLEAERDWLREENNILRATLELVRANIESFRLGLGPGSEFGTWAQDLKKIEIFAKARPVPYDDALMGEAIASAELAEDGE